MFGLGKRKKSRAASHPDKVLRVPPNIKLTEKQREALVSSSGIVKTTDSADPKLQKWNFKER